MENKKGILLPETLKIIIAVLCILLLIYLAWSLYGLFKQRTRVEQANANLDEIKMKMGDLKEGESTSYVLISPDGYMLTGWPIVDKDSGKIYNPKTCEDKGWSNCLCFCPIAIESKPEDKFFLQSAAEAYARFQGTGSIADLIGLYGSYKIKEIILASCTKDGICTDANKKVSTSSVSLTPEESGFWDAVKGGLYKTLQPAKAAAEVITEAQRQYSISVDDAMNKKKQVEISLKNGAYEIKTK